MVIIEKAPAKINLGLDIVGKRLMVIMIYQCLWLVLI